MSSETPAAVVVPLPQPTGRRLRLGPFPSTREALKFVTYAAVGGVVAGLVNPLAWLPFVGGGFVLATYQPEGRSLDGRAADYVRWRWRCHGGGPTPPRARVRGPFTRTSDGRMLAVLAAGGAPVAFLPAEDARRRFDQYRQLLRSLSDRVFLRVGVEPLLDGPFRGRGGRPSDPDAGARAGYVELVRAVCRRRFVRRVDVILFAPSAGPTDLSRLESEVQTVRQSLEEMGVPSRRLRGSELARAVERAGYPIGGAGAT